MSRVGSSPSSSSVKRCSILANVSAQLLAAADLPRFAELGIACSVQFSHAPSDRDLADRFWAGKTDGAYAFRSLWESGALLANGSAMSLTVNSRPTLSLRAISSSSTPTH